MNHTRDVFLEAGVEEVTISTEELSGRGYKESLKDFRDGKAVVPILMQNTPIMIYGDYAQADGISHDLRGATVSSDRAAGDPAVFLANVAGHEVGHLLLEGGHFNATEHHERAAPESIMFQTGDQQILGATLRFFDQRQAETIVQEIELRENTE